MKIEDANTKLNLGLTHWTHHLICNGVLLTDSEGWTHRLWVIEFGVPGEVVIFEWRTGSSVRAAKDKLVKAPDYLESWAMAW